MTFGTGRNSPALYSALESKLGGAIRGNISNCSNLGQTMLLAAYTDAKYEQEKIEKFNVLRRRFEKVRDLLVQHPEYKEYFIPLPFNSGYFMCVKMVAGNAEQVRSLLIRNYSTGVIAQGDCLRLAFSSAPLGEIEQLLDNIYQAAQEAAP
jgi:aspartate/tyrosine/aromatic aminotransferase